MIKKKKWGFVVFITCRQNQTTVQQWKIAVNFICKLANSGVSEFMNYVSVCAKEGIILCGAAPTCIFPHSGIRPSSWDHPTRLDHDWHQDKPRTKEREMKRGIERTFAFHSISVSEQRRYLPYLYGMGCVFSASIWWRRGVKILQASRSSSLGQQEQQFRNDTRARSKNIDLNYNPRN